MNEQSFEITPRPSVAVIGATSTGSAFVALLDEIERLRTENANLREQLAGHQREAMIRNTYGEPVEGPCRHDELGDPHDWVDDAYGIDTCSRCGTECGQ